MIRVAITVEGLTERVFVNQVLAPHLETREIYSSTVLLGRSARRVGVGGNVTIDRLAADMVSNYHRFDFVTSLVDFYGFRDKGTRSVGELEQAITQEVEKRIQRNWDERKVISYVQQHELEGLLFAQVDGFASVPGADDSVLVQLARVRAQFSSPEEINDNPDTAPSKRIMQVLPDYVKTIDGPQIAQAIGLGAIRQECPRFDSWVTRLESLSA